MSEIRAVLKRLYISNYALIDELSVSFPGKLTVITGETGAGKSIFLDALGLALGNRADGGILKNKNKKCIVEAEFNVKAYDLNWFFEENGLDKESEVILRREISPEGKSRAFICDTPVNLQQLKQLSELLIDVHSQHQTLLLNNNRFQFQLLDSFSGITPETEEYKRNYSRLNSIVKELEQLKDKERQAKKELDYYSFLFSELDEINLDSESFRKMEEQGRLLDNAETIKIALSKASGIIGDGENNILQLLNSAKQSIIGISKYNNAYATLSDRLNGIQIELKDLFSEIERANQDLSFNPLELERINEHLDKINRLMKKHSVASTEELIQIKNELEIKLQEFSSIENQILKIEAEKERLQKICIKEAETISKKRKASCPEIESRVNSQLSELSMPNARLKIELNTSDTLTTNGIDNLTFKFSANKGGDFKDLNKVASGGEMSRLMLCLKSLAAEKKSLPTIIFDEIDTGISGDVADKMGNIFLKMANSMQVISITHLPQIASKGSHHLFVYKKDDKEQTSSFIKCLEREERVVEIAKMLSTGKPTESAIKNATDLLQN